ncbi:MAG: cell division protein FtsZ [Thermoplasmatales archaeon]|nr:cell division protein FtsZ [Thermoplasmatales archaeon]
MHTRDGNRIDPRIAVVGVGGAGCNFVDYATRCASPYYTIAINTDRKALVATRADKRLYICRRVTRGQGTGGDSLLGKRCAQAHEADIADTLAGFDVVFIVAGLGGGTGTGAAPVVADIAQGVGAITVAVAITPFGFENARARTALVGYGDLKSKCGMVATVDNGKVAEKFPDLAIKDLFRMVNGAISAKLASLEDRIVAAFGKQLEDVGGLVGGRPSMPGAHGMGFAQAL